MGELIGRNHNHGVVRFVRRGRLAAPFGDLAPESRIDFSDPRLRVLAELRAESRAILAQTRALRRAWCDRHAGAQRLAALRERRIALRQLRMAIVTLRDGGASYVNRL